MAGSYSWKLKIEADISDLKSQLKEVENKDYKINLGVNSDELDRVIKNLNKMLDSLGKGSGDFKQFEKLSSELTESATAVKNLSKAFGTLDNASGMKSLVSAINNIDNSLTSLTNHFGLIKNETKGDIVNTSSLEEVLNLFKSIEKNIFSVSKSLGTLDDGKGFAPLIQQVNELKSALSGLKMNLNLDIGNMSNTSEIKIGETRRRLLNAYRDTFNKMRNTGKTTKEMVQFSEPENASDEEIIGAYKEVIQRAKKKFATSKITSSGVTKSNVYKDILGDDFEKQIKNAQASLRNAQKASKEEFNLENIFGNVDLSGVVSQLQEIANKLDIISSAATGIKSSFDQGINIGNYTQEIDALTNKVKTLEDELAKVKVSSNSIASPETNISFGDSTSNAIDTQVKKQREYNDLVAVGYDRIQKMKKISESGTTGQNSVYDLLRLNHEAWDEVKANNFFNTIPEEGLKRYTKILEVVEKIVQEMVQASGLTENQIVSQLKNIKSAQGGNFKLNGADSGWTHFATYSNGQKDSMQKPNGITYKVYAAFDDIKDLNQNVVSSIMNELTKAGFKGRLKTTSGSTSFGDKLNGLAITDQMVVHGSTKKDQKIAYNTLKNMGLKLSYLGGGIDTPDGSFSQTLASGEINKYVQGLEKEATTARDTAKAEQELANARKESTSTVSQNQKKDAFQSEGAAASVQKVVDNIKEARQETEQATDSTSEYLKILTQVGETTDDRYKQTYELNNGQIESRSYRRKRDEKGNYIYDDDGSPIWKESSTVISNYQKLETEIVNADNALRKMEDTKKEVLALDSNASTTFIDAQIDDQKQYILLLEQTIDAIAEVKREVLKEDGSSYFENAYDINPAAIEEARKNAELEYNINKGAKADANNAKPSKVYDTLISKIEKYEQIANRIGTSKEKFTDVSELQKIREEILDLQKQPILTDEQVTETKARMKEISDAIAQGMLDNSKSKQQQFAKDTFTKATSDIKEYESALNKLSNLRAKQANAKNGKDFSAEIKAAEEELAKLSPAFKEAQNVISSFASKSSEDLKEIGVSAKSVAEQVEKITSINSGKLSPTLESAYNNFAINAQGNLDKYNKWNPKSDDYSKLITDYQDKLNKFNEIKKKIQDNGSIASKDDVSTLNQLIQKMNELNAEIAKLSTSDKGTKEFKQQALLTDLNRLRNEFPGMSKDISTRIDALEKKFKEMGESVNFDRARAEIAELRNELMNTEGATKNLWSSIKDKAFYGLASQIAGMFGFYDVINVVKEAGKNVIQLNSDITDLAKVSEATTDEIYKDFDSYKDIATEIGGTISDTISATADWSRNGYNIPDSQDLARVSQLYKNVGDGIDIDTANESLISTLRGFKLEADEAEKIIDVFNEVSNNEPIDSGGIGDALQRSAASFNAANTSLQESVALISATNSVVQNPDKVGNMWKTVSMRIRSATAELEQAGEDTDGMVTSTADLQKMVKSMTGFDILEEDGKTFKSIYDIVLNIAKVWDNLSDVNQSALLQALAGKQQSNALAAALSSQDILEKSYKEAMNADGSAMREEMKYQQSIQYSIDTAKASLEALSNDFISHNFLKDIIEFGNGAINVLDKIINLFGTIGSLNGGLSSGSGAALGSIVGFIQSFTGHGELYCAPCYKIRTVIF